MKGKPESDNLPGAIKAAFSLEDRLLQAKMRSVLLIQLLLATSINAFSPEGSAAAPLDKKRIAVLGGGGQLGGLCFGFLQRAGSLFGTGIDRNCRCLGATSATSVALNRILSKQFILAQADETFIKLTDFSSVESIGRSLVGIDAVVLGTELAVETRPVTPGTFEKTPNDKCTEVYFDTRRVGEEGGSSGIDKARAQQVFDNTIQACEKAGIQHVVAVSSASDAGSNNVLDKLKASTIPCSLIQYAGKVTSVTNYNYQKGLQGELTIRQIGKDDIANPSPTGSTIYREDLAAVVVQCLLSLDWRESRKLAITARGPLVVEKPPPKRPDQCWCVNSHILEEKLSLL